MTMFQPKPVNRTKPMEELGLDKHTTEALRQMLEKHYHSYSVESLFLVMIEDPGKVSQLLSSIYDKFDDLLQRAENTIGEEMAKTLRSIANKNFHKGALTHQEETENTLCKDCGLPQSRHINHKQLEAKIVVRGKKVKYTLNDHSNRAADKPKDVGG